MIPNSLITAASFAPNSLQSPNAWVGHLPFAAWVIQEIKPKIFVELGTHSGNSYFSFCQSVIEAGLSTKCYAVDTWQGDEHAGQYDEEIFAKVNAHHQEHYAKFSRLLRMPFDDAVTYFADESIGLLHIDGLHTYKAVRHDFKTWLPKLAPGAVVIFHDTNVRERNFGVWKLWEELRARYPNNLEFVHAYGLGVLQLNNAPNYKKLKWLQPSAPEKQILRNYFAALGSRQLERFELNELKRQIGGLNQAAAEREGQITGLNQAVQTLTKTVAQRDAVVAERDGQIANLNQAVNEREGQLAGLNLALVERDLQIANLNQAVNKRDGQITNLTDETVRRGEWALGLERQLKDAQAKIVQITSSNSWKIMLPLREARRWVSAPKQQAKRYAREGLRLVKRIYQSLPLSYQTNTTHRNIIAKYFYKLLLVSRSHSATIPVPILPVIKQAVAVREAVVTVPAISQYEDCFTGCKVVITRHQQPCIADVYANITHVEFATIDPKKIKNILIIKLDHIGDVILSLPAIKMLRNKYPQARITILSANWAQFFIETTGDIDEFIICNYFNVRSEKGKTEFDLETINKIKGFLRTGGFDMAIDLRRHEGNGEVFGWFVAKYKVAYYTNENKHLITHGLHLSADLSNVPGAVYKPHITSQLCALIEAIPDENGVFKKNMPIPVPSIKLEDDGRFLKKYARLLSADCLLGFHPGTGSALRQWPENYFTALADLLIENLNATIVFFGSQEEKSLITRIASRVKNKDKVHTLAGEFSMKEFMLMVKQLKLFVGNVSGPSHISGVLGVPTLAVFAGSVTPYEWHPLGCKTMCVRVDVPCAPCCLAIPEQCSYNLKCLKLLYPEKVYEAAKELLAEAGLKAD